MMCTGQQYQTLTAEISFYNREYWGCGAWLLHDKVLSLSLPCEFRYTLHLAFVMELITLGVGSHVCGIYSGHLSAALYPILAKYLSLLYHKCHHNITLTLDALVDLWWSENDERVSRTQLLDRFAAAMYTYQTKPYPEQQQDFIARIGTEVDAPLFEGHRLMEGEAPKARRWNREVLRCDVAGGLTHLKTNFVFPDPPTDVAGGTGVGALDLGILEGSNRLKRYDAATRLAYLKANVFAMFQEIRALARLLASHRAPVDGCGPNVYAYSPLLTLSEAAEPNTLTAIEPLLHWESLEAFYHLPIAHLRSEIMPWLNFTPIIVHTEEEAARSKRCWSSDDPRWARKAIGRDPFHRYGASLLGTKGGPLLYFWPGSPTFGDLTDEPLLPPLANPDRYTMVLDLDECLGHCYFDEVTDDDVGVPFAERPGLKDFLEEMSQLYELVGWTSATPDYADLVFDKIDPDGKIGTRLYRHHGVPWGGIHLKDLSRLGRSLSRTLIIDNTPENFILQPLNGLAVPNYYRGIRLDKALERFREALKLPVSLGKDIPEFLPEWREDFVLAAGFQIRDLGCQHLITIDDYGNKTIVPPVDIPSHQQHHHQQLEMALPHCPPPPHPPPPPPYAFVAHALEQQPSSSAADQQSSDITTTEEADIVREAENGLTVRV
mmetsp:Transcript_42382/g.105780  ORF Transcript_42382/g.105780 Transcript_42382/m.105780 type:complete len:661 (-) Transcript_42382:1174-3156(-)